jgi:tetratricopeptide (TPR) repeat protein
VSGADMSELARALERARTLMARREFDAAEREYERAVAANPLHPAVHFGLAKLRYMRGDPRFARDLAAVAARHRNQPALQRQFAEVLRLTGDLAGSELLLRDLVARQGGLPELRWSLANVLHETGRLPEAETEASAAVRSRPDDAAMVETLVSIRLSMGRAAEALPLIRAQRLRAPCGHIWIAHEAIAARLIGDPAYTRLYDYDRFVRVYDLEPPPGFGSVARFNAALGAVLRERHKLERPPFDQSMRAGTQTVGNLHEDSDPVVRAAFEAFLEPIADYRVRLGDRADGPLSAGNRGTARYAGCWSVQLGRQGFHVNHIHAEGWLSSAYYVTVPAEVEDRERQSGWIKFGEPRHAVPGAGPGMTLEPRPGRLVLFPSYMWHGTTPIHQAEPRLTIAFDVVLDPA